MEGVEKGLEELVKNAKSGNKEAFTELIINIEDELYKIARMRLHSNEDINEAVQETMIQAFKSIKKLRKEQYFKTWIIKILINKCNEIYRNNKKEKIIEKNIELNENEIFYTNDDKLQELDFFLLIQSLNYKERIALTLYYLEKFTSKEISQVLGESESTIRNRISRSIGKLRKMYEGDDIDE